MLQSESQIESEAWATLKIIVTDLFQSLKILPSQELFFPQYKSN